MIDDAKLRLAESQNFSGLATGYMVSQNHLDFGAVMDAAEGIQMFLVMTCRTAVTVGTAAAFRFKLKCLPVSQAGVIPGVVTAPDISLHRAFVHIATSLDILVGDVNNPVVDGCQYVAPIAPITADVAGGVILPATGTQLVYGFIESFDAAGAVATMTGGTFDLTILPYNPRGQKYYPKAVTIG